MYTSLVLSIKIYAHIIFLLFECCLTVNRFISAQLHALEETQDTCNKRIYNVRINRAQK